MSGFRCQEGIGRLWGSRSFGIGIGVEIAIVILIEIENNTWMVGAAHPTCA